VGSASIRADPAADLVGGGSWWRRGLGVLVVAAVATTFSEVFYWYSGGTDYPGRVVFYLIPTTALLWTLARFPTGGWPAIVLAGAVYGFVTEGVLTGIVYGAFPFDPFAISYTALAWHAPLTVGFGLLLLHRLLARGTPARTLGAIAGFGAFWGGWALQLQLPADDDTEIPGLGPLVGDVAVLTFACYTAAATAVVAVGHLVLGRLIRTEDLQVRRPWALLMLLAGIASLALLVLPSVWWAPLELAVLLGCCLFALARWQQPRPSRSPAPPVLPLLTEPIPTRRLAYLAALPAAAVATYATGVALDPSDNSLQALQTAIVTSQSLLGATLFLLAVWIACRRPPTARPMTPPVE
jgi:hypothetical protein